MTQELEIIKKYEPNLYKACINIFGKSYEYTKQYRDYCAKKRWEAKQDDCQLTLDDVFYDYTEEEEESSEPNG